MEPPQFLKIDGGVLEEKGRKPNHERTVSPPTEKGDTRLRQMFPKKLRLLQHRLGVHFRFNLFCCCSVFLFHNGPSYLSFSYLCMQRTCVMRGKTLTFERKSRGVSHASGVGRKIVKFDSLSLMCAVLTTIAIIPFQKSGTAVLFLIGGDLICILLKVASIR
ncbi:hypothetical protein CEXT_505721 [Caerostris extrusa]|uniref:Transmembrane protein n=1 Tax=Caerostris extrusa TaxID=172846 RepID=A0AAV4MK72_CAEEX|nr:hypothetical protein CEXT_505721 [Caerostris extrusa]